MAQAMTEIIKGGYSGQVIANDIAAACRYAQERYSMPNGNSAFDCVICLHASEEAFDAVLSGAEKAGIGCHTFLDGLILDPAVSDNQRLFLFAAYMLKRAKSFLEGESSFECK